jgi:[citrate (pro-3S)-lyase] ligase
MDFTESIFASEIIDLDDDKGKEEVRNFLSFNGLHYEEDVDFTQVYRLDNEIVATGSLSHNIIKCVAVSPRFRGGKLMSKLMTRLVTMLYKRGYTHHFIFTKPRYVRSFSTYGFHEVVRGEPYAAMLEHGIEETIHKYVKKLSLQRKEGKNIAAMVVDCNPVTYDHMFAITMAASFSDWLHLFLVSEPKYFFPLEIRLELLKKSILPLKNVTIHFGGEYLVSYLTFPKYFIEKEEVSHAHALLGATLFGKYIVPALNITNRYIRQEPNSKVDKIYNDTVKDTLPSYGVKVEEISNLTIDGHHMSARLLRRLVHEDRWDEIEKIVTPETLDFLRSGSDESELILMRMRVGKDPYERV